MPKYVIEREMPGAGQLSAEELRGAAQNSCAVLQELGPQIQWVQSYVTDDKMYCVYIAQNENLVRQHAQQAGRTGDGVSAAGADVRPRRRRDPGGHTHR